MILCFLFTAPYMELWLMMDFYWSSGIIGYLWMALCMHLIANRTGTPNGWLAWIPIFNIYLFCKVAGHSGWWIFITLVPLINIIVYLIFWGDICGRQNRPNWLGILMIIPFISWIIPGVLAFSD